VPEILASIACNLDNDILSASLPLMEQGRVAAIEWSFDALFRVKQIPGWFEELLGVYSRERRLIGHGVFFSLFSGKWSEEQQQWLRHLKKVSTAYPFDHVTEHFGFMTGKDFHSGAPLNIPYSPTTLRIGQDRLARIYEACTCPVGLENLAFSYSIDEVKKHGEFLEKLIDPVNGFIILDLHNLYCQIMNFSIAFEDIIQLYPLERVREIHISGGSWEDSLIQPGKRIRRDTHDDAVPEEVFHLLQLAIPICPNLKYVVLEQLGTGLKTSGSRALFYEDFARMEQIVFAYNTKETTSLQNTFLPAALNVSAVAAEDPLLHQQQMVLSEILESAESCTAAVSRLKESILAGTAWRTEQWDPSMLETAIRIAQKWKRN
jgi:uncharacterized protein (UPF0276 family)